MYAFTSDAPVVLVTFAHKSTRIYICDPKSPWQRGTNENTNRLLRQHFPKKTELSIYSQHDLDQVVMQLNQRPRKTLNFISPADKLNQVVAMTA